MDCANMSRYLSLLLRHHPEVAGVTIDEHGWANVEDLLRGVNQTRSLNRQELERIVAEDAKQRYAFSEDGQRIRANQGHSIPVDLEFEEPDPPEMLWHGTAMQNVRSIDAQGLLPCGRLYVHLSTDPDTAHQVGQRHGSPVIYRVSAGQMARDGIRFFRSVNGVWLTKHVPPAYLKRETTDSMAIKKRGKME